MLRVPVTVLVEVDFGEPSFGTQLLPCETPWSCAGRAELGELLRFIEEGYAHCFKKRYYSVAWTYKKRLYPYYRTEDYMDELDISYLNRMFDIDHSVAKLNIRQTDNLADFISANHVFQSPRANLFAYLL